MTVDISPAFRRLIAGSPARRPAVGRRPQLAGARRTAAETRLREQQVLTRETALVHGPYGGIGLSRACLLPFNA